METVQLDTHQVVRSIVEENLGVYRASSGRLQEDVSQEAQVASDYRGRLVFEILQNADDAMASEGSFDNRVAFLVTDNELWMANSGRALTEADVKGLCGIGASSKIGMRGMKRASIGHKGLGFKSVLEITDAPQVYSRTHSFVLGRDEARSQIGDLWQALGRPAPQHVPSMRFPRELGAAPGEWHDLQERGYNTAFCLPFKDSFGPRQRAELADLLLSLPLTTVLFLKHLQRIEVTSKVTSRAEQHAWTVERLRRNAAGGLEPVSSLQLSGIYHVRVESQHADGATFLLAHDGELPVGAHRSGLTGPAWDGVETTEVSVAALHPDEAREMPASWRHFHVFLPTQEPNPYPLLVNGAFATDLSRRHVAVGDDPSDYNRHLVCSAGRLFVSDLLPTLATYGPDAVLALLDRGPSPVGTPAALLLHSQLSAELAPVPLIPTEHAELVSISSVVLPAPALGPAAGSFREVLKPDSTWDGRTFPDPAHCAEPWARVLVDHGAFVLDGESTLRALAELADEHRSALRLEPDGRFEIDPVLEAATTLWRLSGHDQRTSLRAVARELPLFPTTRRSDGTVTRVVLGDRTAFYPPRSTQHEIPLRRLEFLCHAVCWGSVSLTDRKAVFGERMQAWTGLFDVGEFDFPNVVRAAVLPALVRTPDEAAAALLDGLRSMESLSAICQLAGRATKPDRPLRYQRLEADRALSRLARLPVPTRGSGGTIGWEPAYRVYFGTDWLGKESVEHLLAAVPEDDPGLADMQPIYLAPPAHFFGRLEVTTPEEPIDVSLPDSDEVPEDDDDEQALEGDERERWLSFLSWLGVNPCLRLVHFHDVNDNATGWLTTKGITQPKGWGFADLEHVWTEFEASLRAEIDRIGEDDVVPYLYEAHDLHMAEPLLAASERDASALVAERLLTHLAQHWGRLAPMADAVVALVPANKSPSSRSNPPRAYPEERRLAGDNLWVQRLRHRGICPTSMGPRTPVSTWQPTAELERRFGRASRRAEELLPVLRAGITSSGLRSLADRLGVRREIAASTFTLDDARQVCHRITQIWPAPSRSQLPQVKGIYREVFELLSGHREERARPLSDVRLLADTPTGLHYAPAGQLLYVRSPGSRERSGVGDAVSVFVLEAEPAVTAPISNLFGARALETSLEWDASSEEIGFADESLAELADHLDVLARHVLARVKVERNRPSDATRDANLVNRFFRLLEPVRSLTLACTLDGALLARMTDRPYYVDLPSGRPGGRVRIVWDEQVWPLTPEVANAIALALADALGLSLVEAFDSLIRSTPEHRRRLLALAGAEGYLDELEASAFSAAPDEHDSPELEPTPTPGAPVQGQGATEPAGRRSPAAPILPLHAFHSLTIDGVPMLVAGTAPTGAPPSPNGSNAAGGRGGSGGGQHRAALGTDLNALDALGMAITMAYERRRLSRLGMAASTLAVDGDNDCWVVPVDTVANVQLAVSRSDVVARVIEKLEQSGISRLHPGFDVLTIEHGTASRLIELKSSGVDARVQEMSWNEWKSAATLGVRSQFWLYLVGNLRADLRDAVPFVRAVKDPFGTLGGLQQQHEQRRRVMQLRVQEFREAEVLQLGFVDAGDESALT